MTDGKCLRCGADELRKFVGTGSEFSIPLSFLKAASVIYLICVDCGHVELCVERAEDLPLIAEKYPKG